MVNMKTLIRIVFVIFIANRIDCLGSVCDDFCGCRDCLKKKEYEEIEGDENNPAKELVNKDWFKAKKNKPVLKIFIKEENGVFKDNENKVLFKLDKNDNSKIKNQDEAQDPLKLSDQKYALFEIKTQEEETVYLYCSDIESGRINEGIFTHMGHINISVIACDIENVRNMNSMFCHCYSLEKLDLQNFNTTGVTNMREMFALCSNLTELNIQGMFSRCSGLENLNLNNFNTEKVTNMRCMFLVCISLGKLEFGKNFNTTEGTNVEYMFRGCQSFPDEIRSNLNDVEGIINFFKEKNN